MRKFHAGAVALTLAATTMMACGGDASMTGVTTSTNGGTVGTANNKSITVNPRTLALLVGAQGAISAVVSGNAQPSWRSTDTTVVAVANGTVSARKAGFAYVVASARGVSDSSLVTVKANVASVRIAPDSATVSPGAATQFTLSALDASGAAIQSASAVTATWSSSATGVALVDGNGRVMGVAPGEATITASVDGKTASAKVRVAYVVDAVHLPIGAARLTVGQATTLAWNATDASGAVIPASALPAPTWSSTDERIASVSPAGVVTAHALGSVEVSVSVAGRTATIPVSVVAVGVHTVSVALSSNALSAGTTANATATARDSAGNVLTGRAVSWSSSNPTVATVTPTGLVTAIAAGTTNIVATVEGKAGAAAVTVSVPVAATVASVVVTLSPSSIAAGATSAATATAYDASGNVLTGRAVTWSTANAAVATVTATGVVTGIAAGNTSIRAAVDGKNGAATISVTAPTTPAPAPAPAPSPAAVATVSVSLGASSVVLGGTTTATAVAKDAGGTVLTGRAVTWTSSNPGVATVSAAGLVTAVTAGSATITATVEGKAGSAAFTASVPTITPIAPSPLPTGVLATHNFDNGLMSPFSTPYSSDVDVVDDPTGSGKGKVARFRYAGSNQDRNRSMKYSGKLGFGQTLHFKGEFHIPAGSPMNIGTLQRKLLYWQPYKNYTKYGPSGGPVLFSVIGIFGDGLKYQGGYVKVGGGNVEAVSPYIAKIEAGKWYTLEKQITFNSSPAATDGVVRIWLNGAMIYEKTGMSFTDPNWGTQTWGTSALDWNDIHFNTFLFGDQVNYTGTYDEYRYWDNVTFSTNR